MKNLNLHPIKKLEIILAGLEGLGRFYDKHSEVVFGSDIQVTRVVKFQDDASSS